MVYRVCKTFQVESGHMLSKHPGLCRHPHGHTRTVSVVLASDRLDATDMVCDFKAVKLALRDELAKLDHAMAINSADPLAGTLRGQRLVIYENEDPTTEVMARRLYQLLERELASGKSYTDERGDTYRFAPGVRVQRVRVSETATSWAEFGAE